MPNWVEQDLHVVGRKSEIDRFIRAGYVPRRRDQFDDLLYFNRLCPPRRSEPRDPDAPDSGVVLSHFRTRTQALFSMQTAWIYPAAFYARLSSHWPELSFAATVNEEMGSFGGVVVVVEGKAIDLVRDYEANYNRRAHAREVRAALEQWGAFLTADRPWRLVADAPWEHRSMAVDAHFDDDFWFYFRTGEDMRAFRARYGGAGLMRLERGSWRRTR